MAPGVGSETAGVGAAKGIVGYPDGTLVVAVGGGAVVVSPSPTDGPVVGAVGPGGEA